MDDRKDYMTRLIEYLRNNALAVLALVIALLSLAGASYAAFSLPAGSIGTRELRNGAVTNNKVANGSITPAKLDGRAIGGSVRHWARISQDAKVLGGSRGAHASLAGAQFTVTWGSEFSSRCAVLVTPAAVPGIAPIATSVGVGVNDPGPHKGKTVVYVWTYNNNAPIAAPFYVAVVC
jgi:hypothetical protein